MKNREQVIAIILVLVFGFGLFFIGTDGFRAFTAETARTNKLIENQPVLPELTLEDSKNRTYSFDEFEGKYMVMTFIYTSCATVCRQLETNLAEIFEAIPEEYFEEDLAFLSLSFDPERDTPEILDRYRTYFGSDGDKWRMARIPDETEMKALLDDFGVIVIPDGEGDFAHNVAFYIVDREGTLIDVIDFQDIEGATEKVLHLLEENVEG